MNFKTRLFGEVNAALKAGDAAKAGALRLLMAAVHNREIEKRTKGGGDLSEDEMIQIFSQEAKKRREAIELFMKGNRNDLAEKERAELRVIEGYLPTPLAREEVERIVSEIIKKSGARDFSGAMKAVMAELKGKTDAKVVSELVRRTFGA